MTNRNTPGLGERLMRLNPILRWRTNLVRDLEGDVLEIGAGKGENLSHYRRATHVCASEPDLTRAEQAKRTAGAPSVSAGVRITVPITIDVAVAEALPYADASFDHVVSSLVFCSVTDQARAQAEIRRVLKPGGTLHMIEHVRPDTRWLAALFARVTPWWRTVAYNCHLDRPTLDLLRAHGWHVTVHRRRAMFLRLSAKPHMR